MIKQDIFPTFRNALFSGKYSLLIGAGVSTDSHNGRGERLRSGYELQLDLCKLANVPSTTQLHRVCIALNKTQIKSAIIDRYSNCTAGPTVKKIPSYIWKRIYTFNIDDALENAYEKASAKKQNCITINFDQPYEPEPEKSQVQIVHLHGWVRDKKEQIVFSHQEYADIMTGRNPWMYNLAQCISTEPFIISGSALDEIDLEYYLSCRNESTPRRGSAASFLIDPHPDPIKLAICEKRGLTFIEATLHDFFVWLKSEIPGVPDVANLLIPDTKSIFPQTLPPSSLLHFFSDFRLVSQAEMQLPPTPSKYLYGNQPDWTDIYQHFDITRHENAKLTDTVKGLLQSTSPNSSNSLTIYGEPGCGKTTTAMRVAHGMASLGVPVFEVITLDKIDTKSAIECFSTLKTGAVLFLDSAADHIEQLIEILGSSDIGVKLVLLATDRLYRKPYIDLSFGDMARDEFEQQPMTASELRQLVERYVRYGLTAGSGNTRNPKELAKLLIGDHSAIAVCRILNDFKPLDRIVESMVRDADYSSKFIFQHVALAQYCYSQGIRYSILQSIVGLKMPVGKLFQQSSPLRLEYSSANADYVTTQNRTIAERLLHCMTKNLKDSLLQTFTNIANGLAPHVNRYAIQKRTPESRLTGRIFDVDKVVRPFLGDLTFDFFTSTQDAWEWNSRYWEQRALYTLDSDPTTALAYAKHAVSVERHQYPLTTLGKILLSQMDSAQRNNDIYFSEAFDVLAEAIKMETRLTRITVHPYLVIVNGAIKFLSLGGSLTARQWSDLREFVNNARRMYRSDRPMSDAIKKIEAFPGF